MPQMAPMNWIFLFIMSILMLYTFSNLNYFINFKTINFKKTSSTYLNKNSWKW